ncbi:cupin domain-containing protein [Spirosoma sp. KNUC1025]|uniref:cupin domain-containing protein n=1 Tax=Spirosoma sp. KNUC1025 TaxID=2894082 RepID=UPI0038637FE7|nr:cupin domain-containing protein [Spirosoma sp. KNUC1025]
MPKGSEPPRHIHSWEDETFFLLEGRVQFEIGDSVIMGEIGQPVFGPRNVAHQFIIQSEQIRMLTAVTPGDFANFFWDFSQSIDDVPTRLQAPKGPPPADLLARLTAQITGRFGARFL